MAETSDSHSYSSEMEEAEVIDTPKHKHICGPCKMDETEQLAVGYCVDCGDFLCESCYACHRKPRPSRNHVLQDLAQMPKEIISKQKAGGYVKKAKCLMHSNKDITFFCSSHNELCCDDCTHVSHALCKNLISIVDLATNLADQEEFTSFRSKLKNLHVQFVGHKKKAQTNIQRANRYFQSTMELVKEKLEEIRSRDTNRMNSTVEKCRHIVTQITSWQSDIDSALAYNSDQAFVLMKLIESQFDRLADISTSLQGKEAEIKTYRFVQCQNGELDTLVGKITETPSKVRQICLRHFTETNVCRIESMSFINETLMLVSDCNNRSIKLVDTKQKSIVSLHKLAHIPFDITINSKQEAYVTQPYAATMLHFKSPLTDFNDVEKYEIGTSCYPLEFHQGNIILQFYNPSRLVECNKNGMFIRTIHSNISETKCQAGNNVLSNPVYSTLNNRTGNLIVSCWTTNSIAEVNLQGTVKLIVQSDRLNAPRGLAWEADGSLLVCSNEACQVFKIQENGSIDAYLNERLSFKPRALQTDREHNLLYVAGESDQVFIYQMPFN